MQNEIIQYIAELNRIYKAGNATEHTYRPALQRLLENIVGTNIFPSMQITNEPRRIDCGAPDYIVTRGITPVGYIEAKDIGTDLNGRKHKEQFDRYKQSLNNLIITDYITFQLFVTGSPDVAVSIAKINPTEIVADTVQFEKFIALVQSFVGYGGQSVKTSLSLSKIMAAKARLMANIIENALNEDNINKGINPFALRGQLQGFRETLIPKIAEKEFADIYAQTITYGMFAACLNDDTTDIFTRNKAAQLIPQSNPFLRKLFQYIAGYDLDDRIRWIVNDLADLFNYVDIESVIREFDKSEQDPIIHFYETFLSEYDPATGTGTFLAEVAQNIYSRFKNQQGMWQAYAAEHLIPRINGFEILMASYAMAHLKLDMVLQQTGYRHTDNKRLNIYLTNSLSKGREKTKTPFAQWLSSEANEASLIKQDVPVMVVLGNPPYSGESQNSDKWMEMLMDDYKKEPSGIKLQERNAKWINDDYVKFIRYGQYFIEKNGEGILAFINNHSFLDNPTFRGMRYSFYVLDLHGNAKKKETAPDGGKDENVFDIQQGVSINIFVKKRNENE